jgi:hypothetical protein
LAKVTLIDTDVPKTVREAVDQQLMDEEVLLRLEQPDPKLINRSESYLVPGLALSSIVIGRIVGGGWREFLTFAGVLGMAWFLIGRLLNRMLARGVAYAITNRRVFILKVRLTGNIEVKSYTGDMMSPLAKPHRRGPGGDIELITGHVYNKNEDSDFFRMNGLRDVKATEAALNQFIRAWWRPADDQSSSKSSL